MNPKYKFPFYGISNSTYFEYVFIDVIFKETPTAEQKEQFKASAPVLINFFYEDGNCMAAGSDHIMHYDIAGIYQTADGAKPDDFDENNDNDATHTDGGFTASDSQIFAFYAEIEKWLNEIHEISPILLAYRGENEGMTELSDWDIWSIKQFDLITPYFDNIVDDFDYDSSKAEIFLNVLYFMREHGGDYDSKLDEKYQRYIYPGEIEFKAFKKGNIEPLKSITNPIYLEKTINLFNRKISRKHQEQIEKYATLFLSFESKIEEDTFTRLNEILFTHFTDINAATFAIIASKITDSDFLDGLIRKNYYLIEDGRHIESIPLYEKILLSHAQPSADTGFYNNVLLIFQTRHTGLPMNINRNLLALKKCLPEGPGYPSIFFNACVIYIEMEEYDTAYKMVEKALVYYFDRDFMLNQVELVPAFETFQEKTKVLELLKTHEPEPKENPMPRFINSRIGSDFDIHVIYNDGCLTEFSSIILINGHVNISGEFKDVYTTLLNEHKTFQAEQQALKVAKDGLSSNHNEDEIEEFLIIVNGHLVAESIAADENVFILVEGQVYCDKVIHKEIIEQKKTDFAFIPCVYDQKKDQLTIKIQEAFQGVTLDGGIGLNEAQVIGGFKTHDRLEELKAMDEKTDWGEIPASELTRCKKSLFHFDSKGMLFHIPRFMIALLETLLFDEYNFGINVSIALTNVSKTSQTQFSNLTAEQRDAVIMFLTYLRANDDYKFARKSIGTALDNYWLKES